MIPAVESASNVGLPLVLLPFLGSGFVPTDSMPDGLRWFAEHQPFTPLIETARGLLAGSSSGGTAAVAVGWYLVIGLVWSIRLSARDSTR